MAKTSGEFAADLVNNFDDVIDVTKEAEALGAKMMLLWIACLKIPKTLEMLKMSLK